MNPFILLVDDDRSLLRVTEFQLQEAGYRVITAGNGPDGLKQLSAQKFDLLITDLNMPGMDGIALVQSARRQWPNLPIIVITAYGSVDNAIRATQSGINDYLTKPFSIEALRFVIDRNMHLQKLRDENQQLKKELYDRYAPENIIGQSSMIKNLLEIVDKAAASGATVLITGESGSGKELIARALHQKSARKNQPFIAINCAAIPENLMESELFGHLRGAFTGAIRDYAGKFELADGGTIFLDEIGDLPVEMQAKLLRVLQEHEIQRVGDARLRRIDVRVLAATNRNLQEILKQGRFREDLYYRLNVLPLHIPPLRQRREDIPILLHHFIRKMEPSRRITLSEKAMEALVNYDWPGNVRELENVVERMAILYPGKRIEAGLLPFHAQPLLFSGGQLVIPFPDAGIAYAELERRIILHALQINHFNQSKTADYLKIPRHILLYRMKKLDITRPKE
jgi:two-component system NtrC family response regulator